MCNREKLFFDLEFTRLAPDAQPISLGIVWKNDITFYAEFNDYNYTHVSEWLRENVIDNLDLKSQPDNTCIEAGHGIKSYKVKGDKEFISQYLREWIGQFEKDVEFWGDCLAWDWMLLSDLLCIYDAQHYPTLPENVYYIPFDIATVMRIIGMDPDISREELVGLKGCSKHNSLYDAMVIRECWHEINRKKLIL